MGAAGISVQEPALLNRLAASVSKAADDYREASELWPKAQREAVKYSPASSLSDILTAALSQSRRDNLLDRFPGNSLQEKTHHIVQHGLTQSVLSGMTRPELDRLMKELGHEDTAEHSDANIRSQILVALGLSSGEDDPSALGVISPDAVRALKDKIRWNKFDVFMVHHSSDRESVLSICRSLRNRGIYPWVDVEQIQPGMWFQDAIQSAIRRVQAAAVFLGPEGVGLWQAMEIRTFIDQCIRRRIPVIPVLLPGLTKIPDDLLFMEQLNHVRFEETVLEEAALQQLMWGITGIRP